MTQNRRMRILPEAQSQLLVNIPNSNKIKHHSRSIHRHFECVWHTSSLWLPPRANWTSRRSPIYRYP